MTRARRCRGESGQSIAEMALVAPILVILSGIAFNGWSALQSSIRLTTAARSGAISAANDLANSKPTLALTDATTAINLEEGVTNVYQSTNAAADNYVSMSPVPTSDALGGTGVTIFVVTIKISHLVSAWVPVFQNIHMTAAATARYG